MSDDTDRKAWTAKEMAEQYGCSVKTWSRWVKAGKVPKPIRIGNAPKWAVETMDKWLKRKIRER